MRKALYITIGCISVALGVIGIVVPGLPTTPFLLLSSWLFYKSSKRLHDALHRSRWLGRYIRQYERQRGMGRKTKLTAIVCMWAMIALSVCVFIDKEPLRWLLGIAGAIGTCCVLFVVPDARPEPPQGEEDGQEVS